MMLVHTPCFQRLGLAIIITYAPSSNATPEDHTTYYTNLEALIAKVRPRFTILIAGDFNVEVGTQSLKQETPSVFFSSSLADVALRLDSHMSISSEKILCKDTVGPYEQADQNKLKITKTTNHDDPQIPQPDLRFVRESGKPDQEPNQTQTKTGLEPKSNTHNINLPKDTVF